VYCTSLQNNVKYFVAICNSDNLGALRDLLRQSQLFLTTPKGRGFTIEQMLHECPVKKLCTEKKEYNAEDNSDGSAF